MTFFCCIKAKGVKMVGRITELLKIADKIYGRIVVDNVRGLVNTL